MLQPNNFLFDGAQVEIGELPLEAVAVASTFNVSWNIAANTLIHPGAVVA